MVIQLILYSGKQMLCCLALKVSFRICIVQGLASAFEEIKNRCPEGEGAQPVSLDLSCR